VNGGASTPFPPIPPPKDPAALLAEWEEFADRHRWYGRPLAHLVSSDRERLLAWGARVGLPADRLQFHPLKDPRDGTRRDAWHWDLGGPYLPAKR
jgi:hypothetical protein